MREVCCQLWEWIAASQPLIANPFAPMERFMKRRAVATISELPDVIQNEEPLLSSVTISLTQCHREVESERHQMIHPEENHYCQN